MNSISVLLAPAASRRVLLAMHTLLLASRRQLAAWYLGSPCRMCDTQIATDPQSVQAAAVRLLCWSPYTFRIKLVQHIRPECCSALAVC